MAAGAANPLGIEDHALRDEVLGQKIDPARRAREARRARKRHLRECADGRGAHVLAPAAKVMDDVEGDALAPLLDLVGLVTVRLRGLRRESGPGRLTPAARQ